jgi:hypothetical protein
MRRLGLLDVEASREIRRGKEELMKAEELRGHVVALLILAEPVADAPDWLVLYGSVEPMESLLVMPWSRIWL